ncbi:unnamed protein product, partial [Brassica oleracea var. botrytis]
SCVWQGLAYVDFVDDEDLAAAIAKNRKMFLGKKISIERSNPKKGKKGFRSAWKLGGICFS